MNSLLSEVAVSPGANSRRSCPSSSPAHFPSPPEEEFTIRVSVMPCFMQAKPGPQPYLICIDCNAITELWFAGCVVSLLSIKSAHKISWRGCSLMIWQRYSATADSDVMAMTNIVMVSWRKSRNAKIPQEAMAVAALTKPGQKWSTWTELGPTERHPSDRESLEW